MATAPLLRSTLLTHNRICTIFILTCFLLVFNCQALKGEACFASSQTKSPDTERMMKNLVARQWGVLEKLDTRHTFNTFRLFMKENGPFVNNRDHPLLLFQSASNKSRAEAERSIVKAGWTSPWAWGVFPYHHYHSTAWELLVCVQGTGLVQLGGPEGPEVKISKGDVVLIPPGFVHKQLDSAGGFTLLGSYPPNSGYIDTITGPPTEAEVENIKKAFVPTHEPVLGIEISGLYE